MFHLWIAHQVVVAICLLVCFFVIEVHFSVRLNKTYRLCELLYYNSFPPVFAISVNGTTIHLLSILS